MIKLLITGVSGFIGSSFAAYFSQNGFKVTGLTIENVAKTNYLVKNISFTITELANEINIIKPDIIIHAAGTASVQNSFINPYNDFKNSVDAFYILLEGVRKSGKKPIIMLLSSAAVYGNPEILPINEKFVTIPISPYGYHKVICEQLAKEYSEIYSIPSIILRLFSVFGIKQKRLLIWELFNQFQNKQEVIIEGTGSESRDYIYVDDIAQSIINLIPKIDLKYTVVNIASGISITVKELAYKIKDYLKSDKPILIKGITRVGDPVEWRADITYYESLINTKAIYNFNDRLQFCLDYWKQL